MRITTLALSLILMSPALADADIVGRATVVSADTLEIAGKLVRIGGIRVPSEGTTCQRAGQQFDCHRLAMTALMDLTAGVPVRCTPRMRELDVPAVATCFADGYDIGEGMVYTGWARPTADSAYGQYEDIARRGGHGLWDSEFAGPERWSRQNDVEAR